MSEDAPKPTKRARGSYAKLICLRCRERRIKCQLADDGSVEPSPKPQPPEKACVRCRQQELPCVVRKTTLGRPNQSKRQQLLTPTNSIESYQQASRSPSPAAEDLVLLTLDEGPKPKVRRTSGLADQPASVQMYGAITRSFDIMSGLLARDKRFGSANTEYKDLVPKSIDEILTLELVEMLDQQLVWHKFFMPWVPQLSSLFKNVTYQDGRRPGSLSTGLVLALLASIALDIPSDSLAPYRNIQKDLQCHIYHAGQKVLFTLPRHEHTLLALELVHGHRPLALIESQQAAAHTLSGNLYGTLINSVHQRLGMDGAPSRLRKCLDGLLSDNIAQLVVNTLRVSASLMFRFGLDLEEIDTNSVGTYEPGIILGQALDAVGEAFDKGLAPKDCFFLFHMLRTNSDELFVIREATVDWQELAKMQGHVEAYRNLQQHRKQTFDDGITTLYVNQGQTEEALALSQILAAEAGNGLTNVTGLVMFYAIISGARTTANAGPKHEHTSLSELSKRYNERINAEAANRDNSTVFAFLNLYGDQHMDGLERRLTEFINISSDLKLHGVPFVGPPRHTAADILMACKEIVENNAVRIKKDNALHSRTDMQLILLQEAARRLEAMEADGGSADAVARGSVFTASAKLVRNLHRIMWQWKRDYTIKQPGLPPQQPIFDAKVASTPLPHNLAPEISFDDPFANGYFNNWENWPQLGPTELSNLFTYDFDPVNI